MAMGLIDRTVLTDIANAIREQAGSRATYLPSEMAAAVRALDGVKAGEALEATGTGGAGLLSDSVLKGIADAIRAKNGLTELYTPPQMAPAIRALTWDAGLKPRALLLSDGTLEFNYREGVSTSLPRVDVVKHWTVDPEGYASASSRPWDDDKLSMRRARFAAEFAQAGVSSTAYYLAGCSELTDVTGFEALEGVTDMSYMFQTCSELKSIYAASAPTTMAKGSMMFYGCAKLVGAEGYVPKNTDDHSKLTYEGVLTDPNYDLREWCYGLVYADGELVVSRMNNPQAGRELLGSGLFFHDARYNAVGAVPWHDFRESITRVTIDESLSFFASGNMNYWFYGMGKIESVAGLGNLRGIGEMLHTFNSCKGLTELDFRGFDPGSLAKMDYTFGACSNLKTILADADWELPTTGITGFQTFYQCASLVGGAGTTYASSRTSYQHMRIDGPGVAGYLTAR